MINETIFYVALLMSVSFGAIIGFSYRIIFNFITKKIK